MELEDARASGGGCSGGGPDRLSALPDCLLHTIMSFMKARQAVQTCALSTRWRHLWRSVPCLDVDFDEFKMTKKKAVRASADNSGSGGDAGSVSDGSDEGSVSDDDIPDDSDGDIPDDSDSGSSGSDLDSSEASDDDNNHDDSSHSTPDFEYNSGSDHDSSDTSEDSYNHKDKNKYKDWENFEDFTVNLMHRCNIAQLDSFRLHTGTGSAPEFGDRQAVGWGWLRRAMKYCTPDPAPQRGGLSSGSWRLKRLHLCHVLLDNRFAKHVRSVCRTLEDLELDDCGCKIQSVTSHSLKTLVLKNCRWRNLSQIASPTLTTLVIDGGWNADDCVLVILTPAVVYLHLAVSVDHFRGGISINEVPFLDKALISLQGHRYSVFRSKLQGDQFKLLCSISNATSLELSSVGTKVLGKEPRFHEFKNLRNLLLDKCDLSDGLHTLGFFLQGSPNLEKLTLRNCQFPRYSYKKKGPLKQNKISTSVLRSLDFLWENLKDVNASGKYVL
ncbi:hypothetical protein BAE44_0022197 [Dichanthelium oligosanthes]|uniref:F-box domain-containing protein n=1 Tax=Dichanthelium oligosanthes TaxID=888268 RepID=A0A1E5UVA4_9POAL|nr:hypothetical protein BAE44_0022197 [Dichanthelium oligosanthes]